ncbi:phosphatase PAP2 family protein [Halococcus thailandensis]|uniref:PA-phosphatase like phosphoesterase n=1 Tax=Halococcus thailandensis JCM 13552 TaxID=1227457 RepID=M0N7Q7_9EURY|nr:phosphatase PAP2 family protein [Halococcus thailandensis]EMA53901.1 PA-phosphatase like phosphoesterase [Halococcus thailandensis JCM 13552]
MRGLGVTEALDALPDAFGLVFAVLTQLADVWFVLGLLTLVYWFGERSPLSLPRERGALLIALAFGGLSLVVVAKQVFALARPPLAGEATAIEHVPGFLHAIYTNAATATGYGFPSGHALTATVVWGGLAAVLDVGTRTRRALVAGTIVAVVCFARLVLGVHYLVDVLAGVALGLAYLGVVLALARGRARRAFWIAATVAVVALLGTVSADGALALGATAGALAAWEVLGDRLASSGPMALGVGILGMAVLGGGFVAVYLLDVGVVITALAGAVVGAGVVAMPVLDEQIGGREKDEPTQNVSR